jgi:hypothetical protein
MTGTILRESIPSSKKRHKEIRIPCVFMNIKIIGVKTLFLSQEQSQPLKQLPLLL